VSACDASFALIRGASCAISGLLAAVVVYAGLRVGQVAFGNEPDPAAVFYSEHSGYLWRAVIALYVGGIVGLLTWLVAPRSPERILRWALPSAALALVAQALVAP
jgi:hypothetical protein